MSKLLPFLLSALFFIMVTTTRATIFVITQQDNTFIPDTLTVQVGDTVRWVWTSGAHTTTSTNIPSGAAAWDNPLTASDTQFEYVVTVEGMYNYVCTPHVNLGMTGSFRAVESLGINDKIFHSSVRIYPNPAKEQTALRITSEKPGKGTMSVYDLLGNQINRTEVFIKQGTNNIPVQIENINPGIYFVELQYNNQAAIVRRFVKSR